ncbi:MAG TPA: universal stress protein [Actinocrinis sp.]|nr:universal stress protein [Actinocrinis sp.]
MYQRSPDGPSAIVVGVDGSDPAWRAAAYAAGLAGRQGARLVLVHVQTTSPLASAFGPFAADAAARAAQEVERQVREGAERWEFYVISGGVSGGLVTMATDLRADAVVVGACHNPFHRVLGSPATRLVKRGRWPVIVVP